MLRSNYKTGIHLKLTQGPHRDMYATAKHETHHIIHTGRISPPKFMPISYRSKPTLSLSNATSLAAPRNRQPLRELALLHRNVTVCSRIQVLIFTVQLHGRRGQLDFQEWICRFQMLISRIHERIIRTSVAHKLDHAQQGVRASSTSQIDSTSSVHKLPMFHGT